MSLIRNKASGKNFIVLDAEDDGDDLLLITPEGRVKRLERRLFEAPLAVDPLDPGWSRQLTSAQLDKYDEYLNTLSPRN